MKRFKLCKQLCVLFSLLLLCGITSAQQAILVPAGIPGLVYNKEIVPLSVATGHISGTPEVKWFLNPTDTDDGQYLCSTSKTDIQSIGISTDNVPMGLNTVRAVAVPKTGTPRKVDLIFYASDKPQVVNQLPAGTFLPSKLAEFKADEFGWVRVRGVGPATIIDCASSVNDVNTRRAPRSAPRLHFEDVTVRGGIVAPSVAYSVLVYDRVKMQGVDNPDGTVSGGPYSMWKEVWVRNSQLTYYANGFGRAYVYDSTATDLFSDALQGSPCNINVTVSYINRRQFLAFHPDVLQYHMVMDNVVSINLTAVDRIEGMGIGSGESISNLLVVGAKITIQGQTTTMGFSGRLDHAVFKNIITRGGFALLRNEQPPKFNYFGTYVLFENCDINGAKSIKVTKPNIPYGDITVR